MGKKAPQPCGLIKLFDGMGTSIPPTLASPDFRTFLFIVGLLALFLGAPSAWATSTDDQIIAMRAQTNVAILRVEDIVNQPVTHLKHIPGLHPALYSPAWFHPGAIEPDYNTADVRTTQELPYAKHQYVTSDLNPGEVFLGSELEFNSATKFFYTDRTVPKKKLTEAEMEEINSLYRTIGNAQKQLGELQNPESSPESNPESVSESKLAAIHELVATHKPAVAGILAALVGILLLFNWHRSRSQ
jgi:hypothetical protein